MWRGEDGKVTTMISIRDLKTKFDYRYELPNAHIIAHNDVQEPEAIWKIETSRFDQTKNN